MRHRVPHFTNHPSREHLNFTHQSFDQPHHYVIQLVFLSRVFDIFFRKSKETFLHTLCNTLTLYVILRLEALLNVILN